METWITSYMSASPNLFLYVISEGFLLWMEGKRVNGYFTFHHMCVSRWKAWMNAQGLVLKDWKSLSQRNEQGRMDWMPFVFFLDNRSILFHMKIHEWVTTSITKFKLMEFKATRMILLHSVAGLWQALFRVERWEPSSPFDFVSILVRI